MLITPESLKAVNRGFNAAFQQGFESVKPSWMQVAMEIPSMTDAENYGWMKEMPGMREWIGQRLVHNLQAQAATVRNKNWEHTFGVDRYDIEDDKLGTYTTALRIQGETVARHPDEVVWALWAAGFAAAGLDGQVFFSANHVGYTPAGVETTYSNLQAGAGAAWILADLSRSYMKPLAFQNRMAPQFTALNQATDPNVFLNRQYLYGAEARHVGTYGFHQLAYGSKATLDATNFNAALAAMAAQKRPDGTPLPVMATHLIYGPSNRAAAKALLASEYVAGGESNINYKSLQEIATNWLD